MKGAKDGSELLGDERPFTMSFYVPVIKREDEILARYRNCV